MPQRLEEPCRNQNGNVGFSETKKPGRLGYGQPGRQVQQSKEFSLVCFHILRKLILRWNRRSQEAIVEAPHHFFPDLPVQLICPISSFAADAPSLSALITDLFRQICRLGSNAQLRFHSEEAADAASQ